VAYFVTTRCNQRCTYCPFLDCRYEDPPIAEMAAAFQELARAGMVRLAISGGEPMLRADLGRVLRLAAGTGVVTSMITNGFQVADRARELDPLDLVFVSVDGARASHEAARGRGTYEPAMRAVEALARRRKKVNTITVLTDQTVTDVVEVLRIVEQVGGEAFFQPVMSRSKRFVNSRTERATQEAIAALIRFKRAGRPVGNSVAYLRRVAAHPRRLLGAGECAAGRWMVTVLPNGRLLPCCGIGAWETYPIAGVGSFLQAFNRLVPPKTCPGCAHPTYVETSLISSLQIASMAGALRMLDLRRSP
jgi:MoaA/NifB/PqqE/SkfB family radical SAM enzyme